MSRALADADIDAKEAWAVETGSDDVVVGVIDTGVDFGHPGPCAEHVDQRRRELLGMSLERSR